MNDKLKRIIKGFLTHGAAFGAGMTFDRWLQQWKQKRRPPGDEGIRQLIDELREGTGCTPEELLDEMREAREINELVQECRNAGVTKEEVQQFVDVMQMMTKGFTPLANAMTVVIGVYVQLVRLVNPEAAIPSFQEIKTYSHDHYMTIFARQWKRKEDEWLKPICEFIALILSLSVAQSIHSPTSIPTSATSEEKELIHRMAERLGRQLPKEASPSGLPANLSEGFDMLLAHWRQQGKPALHCDTLRHILNGMRRALDQSK